MINDNYKIMIMRPDTLTRIYIRPSRLKMIIKQRIAEKYFVSKHILVFWKNLNLTM